MDVTSVFMVILKDYDRWERPLLPSRTWIKNACLSELVLRLILFTSTTQQELGHMRPSADIFHD